MAMTHGSLGQASNPAGPASSEATAKPTLRARIMNFLVRLVTDRLAWVLDGGA